MPNLNCIHEHEHEATVKRAKEGLLSAQDAEKMCAVFRMLADGTRLKIVLSLLYGEMCVYHLAELTDSTVSGVSHQLRVLRDNKIVKAKRYGKNVEYSIADEHVREMVELGLKHLTCTIEE